jgi:hypothetical protein
MHDIKKLEIRKLIKELQFIESEYEYQSEYLKIHDMEFLKSVEDVLNRYPDLKELYKNKFNSDLEVITDREISSEDRLISDDNSIDVDIDTESIVDDLNSNDNSELKYLYRQIVKITHPDKVNNDRLNNLYLIATDAYNLKDIAILYKICFELELDVIIPDEHLGIILDKIELYRKNINFLKSTFTFKWVESESVDVKNQIIIEFIKNRIK